jgi:uncharacterized protein YjcR
MDKKLMIEQLVNYYTDGNKTRFAEMLGVKPQTINSWLIRSSYDAELIYSKCVNVSADWLLSGEGSMIKTEEDKSTTSDEMKEEIIRLRAENDILREVVGLKKKSGIEKNVG